MEIKQIFNNNVILSENEWSQEIIVMGRGLGFQKKKGDQVEHTLVEKVFSLADTGEGVQLKELLKTIDSDILDTAKDIIMLAEDKLQRSFTDTIYLTFTDHLFYAIDRMKQGIFIPNPLVFEVQRFYPAEFEVAKEALVIIEKRLQVLFPEDEAGFMALHFVNSSVSSAGIVATMESTTIVKDILSIISKHFGLVFDEQETNYRRLVTHLQYFSQRLLAGDKAEETDHFLYELIQTKYPAAYHCGIRINDYLKQMNQLTIGDSEMIYLVIHINRVIHAHKLDGPSDAK